MFARTFLAKVRGFFSGSAKDAELHAELQSHLELLEQDSLRKGMSLEEARHAARRQFGGIEQTKELYRDQRGLPLLDALLQDLRFALRMLRKSPGFTAVAVLILALGIGANTAFFSVVNAVLLRPLPYHDPEKLVRADEFWPRLNDTVVPNPDYTNWNLHSQSFEGLAAYNGGAQVNLTGAGKPERLESVSVTANLLPMLGVYPALGRTFLPEESQPGDHPVALLSDSLWKEKFGGDSNIPGKLVTLDKQNYTVIGVLPPNFRFPDRGANPQVILPFKLPRTVDWSAKSLALTRVIGRLKPGVSLVQANAELIALSQQTSADIPAVFLHMRDGLQVHITGLHEKLVGDVRPSLLLLVAAVAFVLLIGCVNIANLQIARTASRQKELAVRAAIGAGRARLVRQLLTEGALIATAGGASGVLVATGGVRLLRVYAPIAFLQIGPITMDRRVLLFTLAVTYLTALLFSMVPALRGSNPDVNAYLKESQAFRRGEYGYRMLKYGLVVTELGLAVMMLVASGLLIRSFVRLSNVDPGFVPSNLLTVSTALPESKYAAPVQRQEFFEQVLERISALPGVRSAALTTSLPLTPYAQIDRFLVEGEPDKPTSVGPLAPMEHVSPGYFKTMSIPLLEGRDFNDEDSKPGIHVVIVNKLFVDRFLSNGDPIGKRIRFGPPESPWTAIVGIVGNVRHGGLDHEAEPEVFVPYAGDISAVMFVLRTEADPRGLAAEVRDQVLAVDPEQPVFGISTMEQRLADSMSGARFNTALLSFFGFVALVLASVGVYGVISFIVSQRTHEIGIRVALGATRRNVLEMVMGKGIVMTALGLALGLGGAFAVNRFLSSLLFEVRPSDPATIVGVMVVLGGVALAACYLPARRAMRVDPMVALRYE